MTRIIALDPGGTTGVAKLVGTEWEWMQLGPTHHLDLYEELRSFSPTIIVCERFNYQRRELDKGVSLVLDSCEYIGIVKLYSERSGCQLVMQNPMKTSNPKNFWTDAKLKKLGLYQTNAPHANDATGHLLYYLMQRGLADDYIAGLRDA